MILYIKQIHRSVEPDVVRVDHCCRGSYLAWNKHEIKLIGISDVQA